VADGISVETNRKPAPEPALTLMGFGRAIRTLNFRLEHDQESGCLPASEKPAWRVIDPVRNNIIAFD
jgi:hypothetical protein